MKKLLIIANKPLERDYAEDVEKFDYVVRINRMTNYCLCKGRTDLWLADVHGEATTLFREEDAYKFTQAKKAISFTHSEKTTREYLTEIVYLGDVEYIPFDAIPIRNYIRQHDLYKEGFRITNAIWMLIYCLENFKDYEIHTLGYGGRDFLKSDIHVWHNKISDYEQRLYEALIEEHRITPIDDMLIGFKRGYTGKIPLFSSFWHNTSNVLPDMVVASINSFVKSGCPYHIYTYKQYDNIPDGCIVKDANEIVNESEFFFGARKYYASFADYFRIVLVNKVDTAWTDVDNFFISDDFPTDNVLIIQDGRIQNSFFYLSNDDKGLRFKKLLLECYDNPSKRLPYDNEEMRYAKRAISIYEGRKAQLEHAKWGFGGSCLFTNIMQQVPMEERIYSYEKFFNDFHYTEQSKLWTEEEQPCMRYANKDVRILVMSLALLNREPWIVEHFNDKSYMANIINKYK